MTNDEYLVPLVRHSFIARQHDLRTIFGLVYFRRLINKLTPCVHIHCIGLKKQSSLQITLQMPSVGMVKCLHNDPKTQPAGVFYCRHISSFYTNVYIYIYI